MDSLYNGPEFADAYVKQFAELLPPRSSVVDLGCDTGRHSLFLAGRGHRVLAVDINPIAVKTCETLARHHGRQGLRHEVRVLDITKPILPSRTFGAVVCTYVLQDLSPGDARAVLRTIQRLTADGGLSLLKAYTGNPVQERMWGRTLLRDDEAVLTFKNAGWHIATHAKLGGPLIAVDGKVADAWPRTVVVARKPGTTTDRALSNEELDRLRRSDPEAYEDASCTDSVRDNRVLRCGSTVAAFPRHPGVPPSLCHTPVMGCR